MTLVISAVVAESDALNMRNLSLKDSSALFVRLALLKQSFLF